MISSSGLIQLFTYLFSDEEPEQSDNSAELMMMASGGMMGNPMMGGSQVDIKKQMETERDFLQVLSHSFELENADIDLIEKLRNDRR